MRITKKAKADVDRQILELLIECQKKAIPQAERSNRRWRTIPLVAWMKSISGVKSKVECVQRGHVFLRYSAVWHAADEIVNWIAKKKKLTDWQLEAIFRVVEMRYSGRCRNYYNRNAEYDICCQVTNYQMAMLIHGIGLSTWQLPLNFLIHPRLTDLVLMKCLYNTVTKECVI